MSRWRLLIYAIAVAVIFAAGLAAAFFGIVQCNPPPLPGDEFWTWRQRAFDAFAVVFGNGRQGCFLDDPLGVTLLAAGAQATMAALLTAAAALLWETVGRRARLYMLRSNGGHAILAGDARVLRQLDRRERKRGPIVNVATNPQAAARLSRAHPFREVATLFDQSDDDDDEGHGFLAGLRDGLRGVLDRLAGLLVPSRKAASAADKRTVDPTLKRLGVARARLLVAGTASDLANLSLCETALQQGAKNEMLLRLEQPAVRALGSEAVRKRAREKGAPLTVVSLNQLQVRRGVGLAMPGRYTVDGLTRQHVVVCGSGQAVQESAFQLARQGYGLVTALPLVTVVRTGQVDFAAGALDRLVGAEMAVSVSVAAVDATDPSALDRAISGAVLNSGAPASVHCIGQDRAEAEQFARRWEQVLLQLDRPVPPIVVYGRGKAIGVTGMIRHTGSIDLADAREIGQRLDHRARIAHEHYLAGARKRRGADFGKKRAEREWEVLSDEYLDENRNMADHMDYKLSLVGMAAAPLPGPSAQVTGEEIEFLSPVEHARWVASRTIAGWRHSPTTDEANRLHNNLVPYEDLDNDTKQYDRNLIKGLAEDLGRTGERIVRESPVGITLAPDSAADIPGIVDALVKWKARMPNALPLVRIALDGPGPVALARALADAGVALEILQDRPVFAVLRANGHEKLWPDAASVLARAWRIRVTGEDKPAREAIRAGARVVVDEMGGIDAKALV